jgi:hypothetical protein
MRQQRITEEQYQTIIKDIEELTQQIKALQEKRKKLKNKIRWYDYTKNKPQNQYINGFSQQYFGKRAKDLSPEEKKEYQRLLTQKSRQKNR